jgi:hypothetical protein
MAARRDSTVHRTFLVLDLAAEMESAINHAKKEDTGN